MKPSEFLEDLDSHGAYDAAILEDLDPELRDCVPQYTPQQMRAQMHKRGLGGVVYEDAPGKLIYGWTTASALARKLLPDEPGRRYHGRGYAFRANLAALKEAGF